jgi:hypothetical protein
VAGKAREKLVGLFKLQYEDDGQVWHDVKNEQGEVITFDDEKKARIKLEEIYPVEVKLERYQSGPKRTRVIAIWVDED